MINAYHDLGGIWMSDKEHFQGATVMFQTSISGSRNTYSSSKNEVCREGDAYNDIVPLLWYYSG